nr:immunoglobulin heavy chain junction region [Mus musculus]
CAYGSTYYFDFW